MQLNGATRQEHIVMMSIIVVYSPESVYFFIMTALLTLSAPFNILSGQLKFDIC